jgi:hypothetical protein
MRRFRECLDRITAARTITILLACLMMASAADSGLAGRYAGEWKSGGGSGGGNFRISLEPGADGAWKCEITFTYAGADVKTGMREVKVDQSKLEAAYDFDLMGNSLRSRITGELQGNVFDGRYKTTSGEGGDAVDEGTWSATRAR